MSRFKLTHPDSKHIYKDGHCIFCGSIDYFYTHDLKYVFEDGTSVFDYEQYVYEVHEREFF